MKNWNTEEELVKNLKADFKTNGIKATVRRDRGGWVTALTITVTTQDSDFVSLNKYVEEYKPNPKEWLCTESGDSISFWNWQDLPKEEREHVRAYTATMNYKYMRREKAQLNQYHLDFYNELNEEFRNKLKKVMQICDNYNYDNSDIQTDYFDVGFYMDLQLRNKGLQEVA